MWEVQLPLGGADLVGLGEKVYIDYGKVQVADLYLRVVCMCACVCGVKMYSFHKPFASCSSCKPSVCSWVTEEARCFLLSVPFTLPTVS